MKKTIVREYQLPSSCIKGKQELTIAFLTDLHDQVTGEDGERIFHLLKEQEPDLVLVGGDVIVGKKGCDTSKACAFLKRLSAEEALWNSGYGPADEASGPTSTL